MSEPETPRSDKYSLLVRLALLQHQVAQAVQMLNSDVVEWTHFQVPLGDRPGRYRIGDFEVVDLRVKVERPTYPKPPRPDTGGPIGQLGDELTEPA